MLRDNLVGLIEPMRIQKQASDDRSSCLENPRPKGAESSLTENVTSPFQAEPAQEEVAQLIDAALTPFDRTLLMTLCATGVRRAELTHLKVSDIDSKRMVIHVQGGKGRK